MYCCSVVRSCLRPSNSKTKKSRRRSRLAKPRPTYKENQGTVQFNTTSPVSQTVIKSGWFIEWEGITND